MAMIIVHSGKQCVCHWLITMASVEFNIKWIIHLDYTEYRSLTVLLFLNNCSVLYSPDQLHYISWFHIILIINIIIIFK